MGTNNNKLDELKGSNPFKLPQGYMEGLTDQIMRQIPASPKQEEAPTISLLDRVRPWLYLAAVFVGLLVMFRGFSSLQPNSTDSMLGEAAYQTENLNKSMFVESEEDLDYLEYLENAYLNGTFSEMMANAE